jgi:cytochrome c
MRPGNSLTWILRAVGVLAALAPLALSAGCGGDADDRPAQFSFIYPAIIEPSCATASCHSNYTREAGVNFGLSSGEAYFQLVGRHFVIPSDANDSELIYLLNADGARRMPPDFPLPQVDIDLISTWIGNGAANN